MGFVRLRTLILRLKSNPKGFLTSTLWQNFLRLLRLLLRLLAHPICTFIVYALQLFYGALLGAEFSKQRDSIPENAGVLDWPVMLWNLMPDAMHSFTILVLIISLLKSGSDALEAYMLRKENQKRLEQERRMPPGSWFTNYFVKDIKEIIDLNFDLVGSGQEQAILVLSQCLQTVRKLAASYDGGNESSFSVNLMVAMRRDEVESEISKRWDDCNMFFDGASPAAAYNQIDGILTRIASCNNHHTRLYITNAHSSHKTLLLPIVDEEDQNSTKTPQRVLGAPKAFSSNHPQYHSDLLRDIEIWLYKEQKRFFSSDQADKLYQYYVNDSSVRSLLSIPIESLYRVVTEDNEVIEEQSISLVLNVYASHKNMLRENPDVFINLIQPILDTMALAFEELKLSLEEPDTHAQ